MRKTWKILLFITLAASTAVSAQENGKGGVPENGEKKTVERVDYLALEKEAKELAPPLLEEKLRGVRPFAKRLPRYWSQLLLTERQIRIAYAIQKDYHERIAALEARAARLERERDAKLNYLLSNSQRFKLKELNDAAEKERKAKAAARAKAKLDGVESEENNE